MSTFTPIPFETFTLDNGLRVVLSVDRSAPLVATVVHYHVGSKNERPDRTGFAHFFEHLMFEGTKNIPRHEIDKLIQSAGGHFNAYTSFDETSYQIHVPKNELKLALWIESERMMHAVIDEVGVETQRSVVKEERKQGIENQPYGSLFENMAKHLGAGTTYAWTPIGAVQYIDQATIEEFREFYRTYYIPNNAVLAIVGDIDIEETKELVRAYFDDIPRGTGPEEWPAFRMLPLDGQGIVEDVVEAQTPLPALLYGWRTTSRGTEDDYAFGYLTAVLADGESSRLYRTLVDQKQVALSAMAFQESLENGGFFGMFATARTPSMSVDVLATEFDALIADIRKNGVTDREFTKARNKIETHLARSFDHILQKAQALAEGWTFFNDPNTVNTEWARYEKVTKEDIKFVANRFLTTSNRVTLRYLVEGVESVVPQEYQPLVIDRSVRPDADALPAAVFPAYEAFALSNGLRVFLVTADRPTVTLRLMAGGGDSCDPVSKIGLADACADLLTKGAGDMDAEQFADQVDHMGAQIYGRSTPEQIFVIGKGLKSQLQSILPRFATAILFPHYAEEEIEKYRSQQIDALHSNKSNGDYLSVYAIRKVLHGPDFPLGCMRSEESWNSITRKDILQFHSETFTVTNTTLAVVGNVTREEIEPLLERYFKAMAQGSGEFCQENPVQWSNRRRIVVVDRPAAVQSMIRVITPGLAMNDPDLPQTHVLNNIFGAGAGLGNRLALNLRETHGYTYTPHSSLVSTKFGGHFVAVADVRNEVTDAAIEQIFLELNRMMSEHVPDDELGRNITSAVGTYLMSLASPVTTAARLQHLEYYDLPQDYYDTLIETYTAVTAEEIQQLSRRFFELRHIVVVGKAEEIVPQLEGAGEVEVWNTDLELKREIDYTCAHCGDLCESGRGDGEAMTELRRDFGELPIEKTAVICQKCYDTIIKPNKN